jgi:hypothetical protein
MMKVRALILGGMLVTGSCFSQNWNFNVETGVNIGGLPHSEPHAGGRERIIPGFKPLIGLHLERSIFKGLYADAMVRYTTVGNQTVFHKKDYSLLHKQNFTVDTKEKYSFKRFSYGVGLGYKFLVLKRQFNVAAGYRNSQYTAGNFYYRHVGEMGSQRTEYLKSYDPLSEPSLARKARRNNHEIYLGAGMALSKRLGMFFQFGLTPAISFMEAQTGALDTPGSYHTYSRNDWAFSFSYRVNR